MEKLKKRYGTAVADLTPDDIIQVRNSSRSLKSILRLNLAAVIEARMTDIAEYVWNEIRDAGFGKKLSAGIVLTGGGAGLKNIDELFRRVTGQEVRVACAEMGVATESLEKVSSPASTVAVSLLLRGAQTGACPVGVLHVEQPRAIEEQPKAAEEPATVNDRYGAAATREAAKGPAVADAPKPKPERAEEPEPSKPSNSDDFEDEADDDIATGSGWFSNIFGKVREAFDDAFKKPDDDGDGEW